jgi:hypothetical protein
LLISYLVNVFVAIVNRNTIQGRDRVSYVSYDLVSAMPSPVMIYVSFSGTDKDFPGITLNIRLFFNVLCCLHSRCVAAPGLDTSITSRKTQ